MGSLTLHDVRKSFGSVDVLKGIDLEVGEGEFVVFVGPSGCGKSTLLRIIAGLEDATSGSILINGREVNSVPPAKRGIAMVFQTYALYPHLNVRDNMSLGLKQAGMAKAEIGQRVDKVASMLSMKELIARRPAELSGGQRQRVAIGRAIVREPDLFLFDEPLSNLDAKLRRQVREDIRDIQTKLGLTVVYVTHDQEEALAVSDRIIVMNNAVIAQEGTPRDLYDAPINGFVADFIGEANLLECEIESVAGERASIVLGPVRLDLPSRGMKPGAARIAIRPNRLELVKAGTPNALPARLNKVTYVGRHLECFADTEIGPVFAVCNDVDAPFAAGDDIALHFPERGPVLIAG